MNNYCRFQNTIVGKKQLYIGIAKEFCQMKKYIVNLEDSEKEELEQLIRSRSSKSAYVKRAYLLLGCAKNVENKTDQELHELYHVSVRTIEQLRERFCNLGFHQAVYGKTVNRSKPLKFDGQVVAHLIALACSHPPEGQQQWSLHLLADQMVALGHVSNMSHESVRQLLKKHQSSPGKRRCG